MPVVAVVSGYWPVAGARWRWLPVVVVTDAGGGCRWWRWPEVVVFAGGGGGDRWWWLPVAVAGGGGCRWPEGIFVINKRLEGMEFNSIPFEKEWANPQMKEFMELNSIRLATKQHEGI